MNPLCNAADDIGVCSPDSVRTRVQAVLRAAQAKGWTDEALEGVSGIKARRIKSYRVEGKEPSLSAALSLALALGPDALNPILALVGFAAKPLGAADELSPMSIVANTLEHVSTIASAAADGRIDHTEQPACQQAADMIIATVLPLSTAGRK